jgi:hypothetical protein
VVAAVSAAGSSSPPRTAGDAPAPFKQQAEKNRLPLQLSPEYFFYLADFALNFPANLFGGAAILQVRIARGSTSFLFQFSFGLLNAALNPIFRA